MEREILLTGIGGQGIQLAARTMAEAALADQRRVQLFASYGGMMRGGNSDSHLVIGDRAITAPPVPGLVWAALVMHHEHAGPIWSKLHSGSLVLVNSSVVDSACRPDGAEIAVVEIPALDLAESAGAPMGASLVIVGALVAATGIVSAETVLATPPRVLPSYRSEAAAANRRALEAGLAFAAPSHPAWPDSELVR